MARSVVELHLDTDLGGDIDDLCALAMLLCWLGLLDKSRDPKILESQTCLGWTWPRQDCAPRYDKA